MDAWPTMIRLDTATLEVLLPTNFSARVVKKKRSLFLRLTSRALKVPWKEFLNLEGRQERKEKESSCSRFYYIPGGRTVGMTPNRKVEERREREGNGKSWPKRTNERTQESGGEGKRETKKPLAQVPSGHSEEGRDVSSEGRAPLWPSVSLSLSTLAWFLVHASVPLSFECLPTLVGAFRRFSVRILTSVGLVRGDSFSCQPWDWRIVNMVKFNS